MKLTSRIGALLGCISLMSGGSAAFLAGCGGDDTQVTQVDAGHDARETGPDAADVSVPDDVNAPDVFDAGVVDGDSAVPSGPVVAFSNAMTDNLCARLSTCCTPDAAAFDLTKCKATLQDAWNGSNHPFHFPQVVNNGHVILDQQAATSCLQESKTFSCPSMGSSEYNNFTQNCYGSVYGNIPSGGTGCIDAVECAKGNFCAGSSDGGPNTCTPVLAKGAHCTSVNGQPQPGNDVCAYRGYIGRTLRCDQVPTDAGGTEACQPLIADGQPCTYDFDCTSGLCGDQGTCGSSFTISSPGVCALFAK